MKYANIIATPLQVICATAYRGKVALSVLKAGTNNAQSLIYLIDPLNDKHLPDAPFATVDMECSALYVLHSDDDTTDKNDRLICVGSDVIYLDANGKLASCFHRHILHDMMKGIANISDSNRLHNIDIFDCQFNVFRDNLVCYHILSGIALLDRYGNRIASYKIGKSNLLRNVVVLDDMLMVFEAEDESGYHGVRVVHISMDDDGVETKYISILDKDLVVQRRFTSNMEFDGPMLFYPSTDGNYLVTTSLPCINVYTLDRDLNLKRVHVMNTLESEEDVSEDDGDVTKAGNYIISTNMFSHREDYRKMVSVHSLDGRTLFKEAIEEYYDCLMTLGNLIIMNYAIADTGGSEIRMVRISDIVDDYSSLAEELYNAIDDAQSETDNLKSEVRSLKLQLTALSICHREDVK